MIQYQNQKQRKLSFRAVLGALGTATLRSTLLLRLLRLLSTTATTTATLLLGPSTAAAARATAAAYLARLFI